MPTFTVVEAQTETRTVHWKYIVEAVDEEAAIEKARQGMSVHSMTCNSGLAKYPNGVPEGINADRNCDCSPRTRDPDPIEDRHSDASYGPGSFVVAKSNIEADIEDACCEADEKLVKEQKLYANLPK